MHAHRCRHMLCLHLILVYLGFISSTWSLCVHACMHAVLVLFMFAFKTLGARDVCACMRACMYVYIKRCIQAH